MSRKQHGDPQQPAERMQSASSASSAAEAERQQFVPTGILNLDRVLGGGLPCGALILVLGLPGSGKTTLASQIAFTCARAGKSVLILTALSEPTTKLIEHLTSYRFFDREVIGGPVQFLSIQQLLPQGLPAVADAILAEARRAKVDYVLLDGFRGMRTVEVDSHAARQFLYDVGTTLNALGVTTLITSETDPRDPTFFPEATTADVILGLHYTLRGVRQYRGIEVIKARGAAAMPGMHALVLSEEGAAVYPQLEERVTAEPAANMPAAAEAPLATSQPEPIARAAFGLPEFDAMLHGGIPRGTCTVLAGSLGTGKTLLALNFALAGCRAGEHVVYLSFRESRAQLRQVGLPFALSDDLTQALEVNGRFVCIEAPPIKINPDIQADHLVAALDRTGAQRVVIDSVAELERALLRGLDPQRLEDFLGALLQAMRRRSVTALLIKETDKVVAASLELSADALLSILAENVLLLQHITFEGRLHRILSIPKLRFSDHDTAIREFRIHAPEGLTVLAPIESGEGVLEGITWDQEQRASGGPRSDVGRPRMPTTEDQP